MFKKQHLALAIAATLASGSAQAALETSVTLKNETAYMIKDGIRTGEDTDMFSSTGGDGKGVYKFENTAKIFLNDELENGMSWHGELNIVRDTKAIDNYTGHESNTQRDWLRELYVDTTAGDWDLRIGKQQVVWGTADGIKLLDIINPTDWSEFNQNAPADARIPVWMVNAEKYLDNGGNVQLIIAQNKENKIAGFNSNGDAGHPFVMKGVDAITGQVNGFENITPKLAAVAQTFTNGNAMLGTAFNNYFTAQFGAPTLFNLHQGLLPFAAFTVDGFTDMPFTIDMSADGDATSLSNNDFGSFSVGVGGGAADLDITGVQTLNFFAQCGFDATCAGTADNANAFGTNLMPVLDTSASATSVFNTAWNATSANASNRTSAFEHMPMATFATFNTFAGNVMLMTTDGAGGMAPATQADIDTAAGAGAGLGTLADAVALGNYGTGAAGDLQYWGIAGTSATTSHVRDYPSDTDANLGLRFRNTTSNGLNYSLNYFYGYDHNPAINLSWHDKITGEELSVVRAGIDNAGAIVSNVSRDRATVKAALAQGSTTSILLQNSAGDFYGAFDPSIYAANTNTNGVDLRFTETVERSHNLGTSFDYTLDTESLGGVVLRGEFLYQKDVMSPVVDNLLLGIGDLSNGLKMNKGDMFKYVIGADTNVMTDMMLSGQFIQFRNLDYVDQSETCTVTYASDPTDPVNTAYQKTYDCSRYTADMATMNPTNGLQKAEKNKNFYSLFLSKPFGESGEGRWNNIFIYEEGGGKWNRFDVEYGFDDQLIGTFEVNKYFGDENTMFGQFENASNVQVGIKYLLQ